MASVISLIEIRSITHSHHINPFQYPDSFYNPCIYNFLGKEGTYPLALVVTLQFH